MAHQIKHSAKTRISILAMMAAWGVGANAEVASTDPNNSDNGLQLEEIVVTARKITENLQDAPVSVATVTGDMIEQRGIRDLKEMNKLASSLKVDTDSDVRAGVSIRGVGGSSDINVAPGVGMFVDGVYQPTSAYFTVPFFDVERMEVLKGPQGTLYGKNTMGGAINIISREPTDEFGGNIMVEGANVNHRVVNGVVNVPITAELGNRTTLFYRDTDGLQENQKNDQDPSQREDVALRTRFVYDPDNGFKSSLGLFYANLRSAPFAYSETTKGLNDPVDNVTKNVNGLTDSEYQSLNFANSYDFGEATLTSLTSYDKGDVDTVVDADYTSTPLLVAGGVTDRDTFAQELRLADSNTGESNLHWLVGGYYSHDDLESPSYNDTNYTAVVLAPIFKGLTTHSTAYREETAETFAGFGQVTLTLDQFEFAAGIRYDKEERDKQASNVDQVPGINIVRIPVPPFFIPQPVINTTTGSSDQSLTSEEWQPKVSVSYHFTPDIMGYGLVSRGFRAGGFNPSTAPAQYDSYQPEKTTNYEGGLKTELMDRRLRVNTAVFYTDYSDIIQTDQVVGTNNSNVIISRNGGEATSRGFELDIAYNLTEELNVSGGYTYLDIENDKKLPGQIRKSPTGFADNVFNVQANYFHSIDKDMTFGANLSANYIGDTPMGLEEEYRDASTVVDASVDLSVNQVTFSVFGKNIFDEQYYVSYIPKSSTANALYGIPGATALGLLNQPAQYGMRVSTTF